MALVWKTHRRRQGPQRSWCGAAHQTGLPPGAGLAWPPTGLPLLVNVTKQDYLCN